VEWRRLGRSIGVELRRGESPWFHREDGRDRRGIGIDRRKSSSPSVGATTPPQGEDKPSPLLWTGLASRLVGRGGAHHYGRSLAFFHSHCHSPAGDGSMALFVAVSEMNRQLAPPTGDHQGRPYYTRMRLPRHRIEFSGGVPFFIQPTLVLR
jgi:hypothetical protein